MNGLILGQINPNLVDAYNPNGTYQSGEYCIKNDILYKANQNINVAEPWTQEHWTVTTIGEELSAVNSKIGNVELLRSATDSYNVTWSLYRIAGHIYQLAVEKRDQTTHFPVGKIACPFTLEDSWKPTYSVLTSGITQSNTAFNMGVSPSGVSGWSYGSFTGQLFCNLVWFG